MMQFFLLYWKQLTVVLAIVVAIAFIYQKGKQHERDRVEKQNNEAIERGIKGANSVRACAAAGGLWDISTGKCERPR